MDEKAVDASKGARIKRRKPWAAFLLSFFLFPGLGRIYCGSPLRGFLLAAVGILSGLPFALGVAVASDPRAIILLILFGIAFSVLYVLFIAIMDAFHAKRRGRSYVLRPYNRWYFYVLLYIAYRLLFFSEGAAIQRTLLQAYKIPSGGMQPTLRGSRDYKFGDHILVNKRIYGSKDHGRREPSRGEIVVFRFPVEDESGPRDFIFRIAGLPGDRVSIRDGKVLIDGVPLMNPPFDAFYYTNVGLLSTSFPGVAKTVSHCREKTGSDLVARSLAIDGVAYAKASEDPDDWDSSAKPVNSEILMPEGHYFVLGDNSRFSRDSRMWGFVPRENIRGKAFWIYLPPSRFGPIQ